MRERATRERDESEMRETYKRERGERETYE